MKRLVGLMLGLFLAVSAADVSVGAMSAETDTTETSGFAGDPEVDEDSDAIDQALLAGQLLGYSAVEQQRLAGEIGCAEQGHATEINFPPWG